MRKTTPNKNADVPQALYPHESPVERGTAKLNKPQCTHPQGCVSTAVSAEGFTNNSQPIPGHHGISPGGWIGWSVMF